MKGNVIVGQSGGPTSAINSSLAGVYSEAVRQGAPHVYGMVHGIKGLMDENYIDMRDYIKDELDVELLKRTPAAWLGSCRYKLPKAEDEPEVYEKIFEILDKLDIECFHYIGGNDSMDTINKLSDYGAEHGSSIKFVGVPKTIDNDLACTDHTPGYGSAAKYIATSVKEVIKDCNAQMVDNGQCTVIEIMGRDAGWLTGAAALSKGEDCEGPDLIYLPEVAFDMDKFMAKVKDLLDTKKSAVICVSEGIRVADGTYVCELASDIGFVDAFGHKQLSGTATSLANKVANELGCKGRGIELSTLQRAAAHLASGNDISEAFEAGAAAVRAAAEGKTGLMVTYERISDSPYLLNMGLTDVHNVSNVAKSVPREWINEEGDYVTEEFINYARPLIMGEVMPIYVDGIPKHLNPIE